jgi:chromosome segregation ATPase
MASRKQNSQAQELRQLRSQVRELRVKLATEAGRRKADTRRNAVFSKQVRAKMAKQIAVLTEKGQRLANQLAKALGDAKRRQKAREDAIAKLNELREELRKKTDELRRKSLELAKLARESAERARAIITEEPSPAPSAAPTTPLKSEAASGEQSSIEKPPEPTAS